MGLVRTMTDWLRSSPMIDWFEGYGAILAADPPAPQRSLYRKSDAWAHVDDWLAVGDDLRVAMNKVTRDYDVQ